MNTTRFLKLTLPGALFAYLYSARWYLHDEWLSNFAVYPTFEPFVYRVLVPILAQGILMIYPVRVDLLVITLMTLCGAGLGLALWYLASSFYDMSDYRQPELIINIMTGIFFVMSCKYPKLYDISTAILFSLCVASLMREKYIHFLTAFTLATMNRETALLLIPFVAVWLLHKGLEGELLSASVIIYGFIEYFIRYQNRMAEQIPLAITLAGNLREHLAQPLALSLSVLSLILILYFVFKNWQSKPYLLRLSFMTIFPVLFMLYLCMGQAYEFRVFGEVYPFVALLVWKGVSL